MKLLTVLFLNGTVDAVVKQSVTVELEAMADCEPIIQVMPLDSFPCDIREGDAFHLLKLDEDSEPVVVCGSFVQSANQRK
tara:strand:- start:1095 stop:1334 length:240 start_codon:yes stop_codon:yes gene_type:complete